MGEKKANEAKAPKLFISYSWTSAAHVDWVLQLATDLRSNGVDVVMDQWHLQEGQDAHSFMESMVRDEDMTKVVLVCDEKYVDRADNREGGVGVESQIVTKKIYGDVAQTKFVALARATSDDGDALLPNFLSSRIYIDFRDNDRYAESLTTLLRWVFGKPLHALPEIGEPPKFLDEQISFQPISLGRLRSLQSGSEDDPRGFLTFWREASEKHADFTLELSGKDEGDQIIADVIEVLPPLLSQCIVSVRNRAEVGELKGVEIDILINYFETVLSNYSKGSTNWGGDVTKFFGEFIFVAMIAILLRYRRFGTIDQLLGTPILKMGYGGVTAGPISFPELNSRLDSLNYRNQRLKLNRSSLHADFIRDTCGRIPLEFWEYLQADFYLFLYFDRSSSSGLWWPDSNIYATDRDGAFPLFARATQPKLRDGLLGPLRLATKEQIEKLKTELDSGKYEQMRWSSAFSRLNIWQLGNFAAILDSFA